MFDSSRFLGKFALIASVGLLMLTVFDGNPWWKILFYAIPATLLNLYLTGIAIQKALSPKIAAALQGVAAAFLAYLVSLTTVFRTTFGSLVGLALLLTVADYVLAKFFLGTEK